MKYKVGDKLEVKKHFLEEAKKRCGNYNSICENTASKVYLIITDFDNSDKDRFYYDIYKESNSNKFDSCHCIPLSWCKPFGAKEEPVKPKQENYVLIYQLDNDPVEIFESINEVKERLKELYKKSSFKKETVKLFSVKRKYNVSISTRVEVK